MKNEFLRFRSHFIVLAVAIFVLTGCRTPGDRQFGRQIDQAVEAEMKRQHVVGAAVGIIRDNRIVHLKGYGLADRGGKIPVDTDSMFRWASISKPLTALRALQLWEEGKLDLDADVRTYVPEFPDKGVKITLRQLLGHQGGIVHYQNGPVIRAAAEYDVEHPFESVVLALDTFRESPLVNPPGEKYSYSTHGYILASAVVERAGKCPFADQVDRGIAQLLGMKTVQPDYQWLDIPNRASGYRKVGPLFVPSRNRDVSWKLGGGGYISSIDDLARLARGLLRGNLVSKETEAMMWTPQKTTSGKVTRYGLGFSIDGEGDDLRVSHGGSQEKVKTWMGFFPNRRTGVVLMCNSEHVNPTEFGERLAKLVNASDSATSRD
jgi:CubicO group peptidase (beta-lactamase class C family)